MKTTVLTGLAAFALGATCATALTGTGSAVSVAGPVASTTSADDSCRGPASTTPSCVVERILTLETPSPSPSATATPATSSPPTSPTLAADDDGTPDQGRGDRPAATATAAAPTDRRVAPATVKLRGDGSVDDSQPGAGAVRGDDDGTPDQGRGDRPGRAAADDEPDDDRSGRRGGEDRSGRSHDDSDDRDRSGSSDDDHDDSDSDSDDGTADQGSGDR